MDESGRGRWLGLAMLSLGVAMIIVDATIVNVSVPAIIGDLGLQATQAEWVNTSYALVFAALLITLGRLGDQRGRRGHVPGRPRGLPRGVGHRRSFDAAARCSSAHGSCRAWAAR